MAPSLDPCGGPRHALGWTPGDERGRHFQIFWAGQVLSMLGDAFALVALPLLVLELTGSVAKMGLLTAAAGAAQMAMGLSAGWIVDRFDRRQIMILCDVARALLFALVPVWGATIGPSMGLVYTVTVLAAALSALFAVGYVTAVPNLVGPERVTEANGRLTASQGVCFVVGPALAGLLCARFGPAAAVGINALSFVASAVSIAAIRIGRGRADPSAAAAHPGSGGALVGVRFVLRHPVLRAAVLCFSVLGMLGAGVVDLLIFLLKHGMSVGDGALGLVLSLGAVGAALGGVVTAPVRRRFGFGACFIGASALEAVAVAGVGLSPATYAVMGFALIWAAGTTVRKIITMSLRQQITPDHLLGRVTAAFWTLCFASAPVGAALATWTAERVGVRPVLVVTGGLLALTTALVGLTPLRLARPETAAHPTDLVSSRTIGGER